MINDLQWSMVFNYHSILLHRDYYWLIMDYNHDFRLKHFPDLEISRLRNFLTLNFFNFQIFEFNVHPWSMIFNDLQWSFNTTVKGLTMDVIMNSDLNIFQLRNCSTLKFLTSMFINDQWPSIIIQYYCKGADIDTAAAAASVISLDTISWKNRKET